MSARWYVVWTLPRQERRAEENLERQGFETFLPRTQRRARRQGRLVQRIEPMFPRYLFIRANAQVQSLAPVRSSRGCADLVKLAGRPATVPDAIVADVQKRCGEDGIFRLEENWRRGQELEILDGPFSGLKAIYQAATSSGRVQVLLQCLGAWQRATVPRMQVAALS